MAKKISEVTTAVPISYELRKTFAWIDEAAADVRAEAIGERRKKLRMKGSRLSPRKSKSRSNKLERITRKLITLKKDLEKLVDELKIHWAYMTKEDQLEIIASLGKTLIGPKVSLSLDSDEIHAALAGEDEVIWRRISKEVVEPVLALTEAETNDKLRARLIANLFVSRFEVAVTAPSMRRGPSGEPQSDPQEE
jgi:hypothetical protein